MSDAQPTKPREIHFVSKAEAPASRTLAKAEQMAKIVSLIAIPIIVAWGGWRIQDILARRNTSKGYVELALTIVSKPKGEIEPGLRNWAWDLLNANAPTKIAPETLRQLKAGEAVLHSSLGAILSSGGGSLAISPDGRVIAIGENDGSASVWDLATGRPVMMLRGHTAAVIGVAFSPDGKRLFTRSLDATVRQWDTATGKMLSILQLSE
jgi:hypothetical protein